MPKLSREPIKGLAEAFASVGGDVSNESWLASVTLSWLRIVTIFRTEFFEDQALIPDSGGLSTGAGSSTVLLSSSFAIVVVEEAAQANPCFDGAFASSHALLCMDDAATQSLMVSLAVVVLHILLDGEAKMPLPNGNDLVQTLKP